MTARIIGEKWKRMLEFHTCTDEVYSSLSLDEKYKFTENTHMTRGALILLQKLVPIIL